MAIRIYKLAKELGVESKLLIERCKAEGYAVKSHMSSLADGAVGRMRAIFEAPKRAREEAKVKVAAAPKAKAPSRPPGAPPRRGEPTALVAGKTAVVADQFLEKQTVVREKITPRVRRRGRPRFRRKSRRRAPRRVGPLKTEIELSLPATIKALSSEAGLKASDIMKMLVGNGIMCSITEPLPEEALPLVSKAFGVKISVREAPDLEGELLEPFKEAEEEEEGGQPRAPVVTLLGHVDHGKTSLLDVIRQSNLTARESGGITQHIGAYKTRAGGHEVVFLDTPGHEAFTAMRARGANVTDVVVLVVAADDGVMAQTDEAIAHARAAKVPIVVAINKVDRPDANADRVRRQLAERGLTPEDWGGDTVVVETSAVTKDGISELLEMLSLVAEMRELRAERDRSARGTVLEAELSGAKGVVVHLLVRSGTLRRGDVLLCGAAFGKVRALYDDQGRAIREAGPSSPAEVTGLSTVPGAGEAFYVVEDMQKAKAVAAQRAQRGRESTLTRREHVSLEKVFQQMEKGMPNELRLVMKADVQGSVEVLRTAIQKLSVEEVAVNILYSAVGGITESDVLLADASDAIIIGFHVVANAGAQRTAEDRGVEIRTYQVIYEVMDDIRAALEGMLAPETREVREGRLTLRQTFKISRIGTIAGCYVEEGNITRQSRVRLVRDGVVVYDGELETLRRFKNDAREVGQGYECGVKIANFDDVKEGDELITYRVESVARKLDQAEGG